MRMRLSVTLITALCFTIHANAQTIGEMMNATLACDFKVKGINGMTFSVNMEDGAAKLSFPDESGVSKSKEEEYKACVSKELEKS